MWSILIVLLIGMTIGATVKLSDNFKKLNSKLQYFGVVILLFAMGASLGLNKELLSNIQNIGVVSLVFALLTSVFSIIIVYIITSKYMKGKS